MGHIFISVPQTVSLQVQRALWHLSASALEYHLDACSPAAEARSAVHLLLRRARGEAQAVAKASPLSDRYML